MKKILLTTVLMITGLIGTVLYFALPNSDRLEAITPEPRQHTPDSMIEIPYESSISLSKWRVGQYPWFVDSRRSFTIGRKKSMKVEPGHSGLVWLEFSTPARNQNLKVLHNTKTIYKHKDVPNNIYTTIKQRGFNLNNILLPDLKLLQDGWKKHVIQIPLENADTIEFACESTEDCVISELFFGMQTQQSHSNVIHITVDALRFDALKDMPFLKKYASQNSLFSKAVSTGNMTSPSMNGMFSCQNPSSVSDIAFHYGISQEQLKKLRYQDSFPEIIRENGWSTAAIGNISVFTDAIGVGYDHGFDETISVEVDGYESAILTSAAKKWLIQNHHRPFYLYIHLNSPHAPYKPELKDIDFDVWTSYPEIIQNLYRAEVKKEDRYINEIISAVEKLGLVHNTMIIVSSDHGDQHGLIDLSGNELGPAVSGTFFDHGATLRQDEVHVPIIIGGKHSVLEENQQEYVSTNDIGPTILKHLGIAVPNYCVGSPLQTKLNGRMIGFEGFKRQGIIVDSRYKYIRTFLPTKKRFYMQNSWKGQKISYFIKEQIYDLELDPEEKLNLAESDKKLLEDLKENYRTYFSQPENFILVFKKEKDARYEIQAPEYTELKSEDQSVVQLITSSIESAQKFVVTKDGKPLKIYGSSMLLSLEPEDLSYEPFESLSLEKIAQIDKPTLVKTSQKVFHNKKKFNPVNKDFAEMLRKWGYLNESQ